MIAHRNRRAWVAGLRPRVRTRPFSLAGAAAIALTCLLLAAVDTRAAEEPRVRLVTSLGNIDVELFPEKAPRTVANFLRLVDDGFYDGLIFHRVIANFMIQTGGYDVTMKEREPRGTIANESFNGLQNRSGTLAMARLADPDSAGAQFYINVNDNAHLDATPGVPGYTVFGRVIAGMDVVTDIELADTGIRAGMAGVPDEPIVLERVQRLP
jgi:peptidyl-prolyl cis-trans isomerase A (cyclophilin A)